ncbi:hypothetical protein GJAV_G00142780 [Gymnothorax javanicus]|nr:hypothetical protein GJAV_G00142780 [Gymnothorax javanicus]
MQIQLTVLFQLKKKNRSHYHGMETRFSHLYQRDSSVSMLRVKMARRRSQSQKENRDRAVNRHRGLEQLAELEAPGTEEPMIKLPPGASKENGAGLKQEKSGRCTAVEERMRMLARYKETKELQKEKERREMERKGRVFKVGLYKPQPLSMLPQVSSAPIRAKSSLPVPSSRVTRSMKQQVAPKPLALTQTVPAARKEPAAKKTPPTRAVSKPQITAASVRGRAAPDAAAHAPRTRAAHKQPVTPPVGRSKPAQGKGGSRTQTRAQKVAEAAEEEMDTSCAEHRAAEEQGGEEGGGRRGGRGFVFQAPSGLKPLQSRSADTFHTPSCSGAPVPALSFSPAALRECVAPSRTPRSPAAPETVGGPEEPQHDVPYFRSVLAEETARLDALCEEWGQRTDDPSIPEDCRDRMLTAVGQARLLMKERFGQFQGLVDDCDLGRGEKVTTCTDLQGFWDMVYFQVEDVLKKFSALKEAESRGWKEELKPEPRPKKTKKPPSAPAAGKRVGAGAEASAAARSRLAAVKAAMKARQAAQATPSAVPTETQPDPAPQTVVFHGGFFRVESPVRTPGSLRRSSLRTAVPPLHGSPCPGSQFTTPSRPRPSSSAHPTLLPQPSLSPPATCTPHPLHTSDPNPASPPRPSLLSGALCSQSEQTQTHSPPTEAVSSESQAQEWCAATDSQSEVATEGAEHTASQSEGGAEVKMDSSVVPISPFQAVDQTSGLSLSPSKGAVQPPAGGPKLSFSLSPCQGSVLPSTGAPELSFTVSPCQGSVLPSSGAPELSFSLSPSLSKDAELGLSASPSILDHLHTPSGACSTDGPAGFPEACRLASPAACYTENTPGLDFERYLRPTIRCSPSSPEAAFAMEALSSLATPPCEDVHMDSPGPAEDQRPEALEPLTAPGHMITPQAQHQLDDGDLLLFTPELRDKVRQSVCERDLMTFTPPCGR